MWQSWSGGRESKEGKQDTLGEGDTSAAATTGLEGGVSEVDARIVDGVFYGATNEGGGVERTVGSP